MGYNFYKAMNRFLFFSIFVLLLASCGSPKDILYFQDAKSKYDPSRDSSKYVIHIAENDNLLISITSRNPQAADIFNVVKIGGGGASNNLSWHGYLVDQSGDINFPLIGKVHLSGLTKTEAITRLEEVLSVYLENPIVNVRIMNYRIYMLGEVSSPGVKQFSDEKVTILQAIAMAGDLTMSGNRHNIMIFRELDGQRQFFNVDITSPDIFNSPVYYLRQNDLVYVEPNKFKIRNSNNYRSDWTFGVSVFSFLLSIFLLYRSFK